MLVLSFRRHRPPSAAAGHVSGGLEADFSAFFGFFVAAALAVGQDFQRRDGDGFAVFDRNHREVAAVGMADFAGADVLCFDTDADFHRGASRVVDSGVKGNQIADVDGFFKQDFVNRKGNAIIAAVTAGAGIGNLVEQEQEFAAVYVAAEIGGVRHHQFGHNEFVGRQLALLCHGVPVLRKGVLKWVRENFREWGSGIQAKKAMEG